MVSLRRSLALTLALVLAQVPAQVPGTGLTQSAFAGALTSQAGSGSGVRAKALKNNLSGIETAVNLCNENPARGAQYLEDQLESLQSFAPEIAAKQELQDIQRRSILVLARAYKNSDQPSKARTVLSEIYRADPPRTTELRSLGPSLESLGNSVKSQVTALGRGSIQVSCSSACEVFVNERRATKQSSHAVGEYRVYVRDLASGKPPLRKKVEIHPGGEVMVRYDNRKAQPTAAAQSGSNEGDPLIIVDPAKAHKQNDTLARTPYRKPKRIAPLWLEVTGLSAGLAAAGTGAVLWLMVDSEAGVDNEGIPQVYDTRKAGIICVAAGAVTALTFGILLAIDQSNVNRKATTKLGKRRWRNPLHLRF